jgi:hypothetical protein
MSPLAAQLAATGGYLVADSRGRVLGKVEGPMYGTAPDVPDALAVKSSFGLFSRKRRIVPVESIEQIDGSTRVIGLRVERDAIRSFL